MKPIVRLLPCLTFLLIACDREDKVDGVPPAPQNRTDRVTKTDRQSRKYADEKKAVDLKTASAIRSRLEIADSVSDPAERTAAITALVWEIADADPDLAREAFDKLPLGSVERQSLLDFMAMRLADNDADAAVEWASRLGPAEERAAAFGNIAQVIAQTNPERAANILVEQGLAGRELDVQVVQVIRQWAGAAPADAAAWVTRFSPGEARSVGIQTVLSTWVDRDPEEAYAWIASVRNPTFHQEAVAGMAAAIIERPVFLRDEFLKNAPQDVLSKVDELDAANRAEMEADEPAEIQE